MDKKLENELVTALEYVITRMATEEGFGQTGADLVVCYDHTDDMINWYARCEAIGTELASEDAILAYLSGADDSHEWATEHPDECARDFARFCAHEVSEAIAEAKLIDKYVYTVYSHTESYVYTDGHTDNVVERGTAATLPAAKRKARKVAKNTLNHATITYTLNGEEVFREVNPYGIAGEWNATDV